MAAEPSRDGELTLVVGEALVDIVISPDGTVGEHVGGSPANVALGLARLGHPVDLATHIGADSHGEQVLRHLEQDGVRLSAGSISADRTPTASARLDDRGVATYTFDIRWELPESLGPGPASHVHIGSIGTALLPGADQVRRIVGLARDHATISFDPNMRPALLRDAEHERPGIEQLVALSDLVKASDEDIAWLYPGDSVDEVLARWSGLGPSMTVVTLGGEGARALVGGAFVSVPPEPVPVVDTVGAGDAFMAGLISGLLDAAVLAGAAGRAALSDAAPAAVRPALDRAIHVAAVTCSRAGADPPYRREL
jgi:fructokinase